MASFFKTATVQTGEVSGTHSNFPVYVDLSDVGVTTLSEANSIRVYTDLAKTNEIAREIVSVQEMHCKVPTLSSTTTLYIDVDDVRADYAVGATYGRNAVWSDYERVYHFNETSGSVIDSSGNDDGINSGATTGATGQIGNGYDFDGVDDVVTDIATVNGLGNDVSFSLWLKADGFQTGPNGRNIALTNYVGGGDRVLLVRPDSTDRMQIDTFDGATLRSHGVSLTDTTGWHHFVGTTNTSKVLTSYLDGVAGTFSAYKGGGNTGSAFEIGSDNQGIYEWNGQLDEVRARHSILASDWVTTEYNNQNDNSAFWGTWTDAGGGGPTANNSARRMLLMQM